MDVLFDQRLKYAAGLVTDVQSPAGLSFVSSAEVPGAWRFVRPLCTELTAGLLTTVRREFRPLVMPYGHFMNIGSLRVALYPAGPLPGAAAILLEDDGRKVLFCAGQPEDSAVLAHCDVVVAVVTASRPSSEAEVMAALVESARTALKAGMVPVIRCNPFGVARAVCVALSAAGLRVRTHQGISRFNRAWRMRGFDSGNATGFRGADASGGIVLLPDHLGHSPLEARIQHPWRISVVRAGGSPGAATACDQAMTLPGPLTFEGLQKLVSRTRPDSVVLTGDGARVCANGLVPQGFSVTVIDPVHQVELL